jgi:hypothetical protein
MLIMDAVIKKPSEKVFVVCANNVACQVVRSKLDDLCRRKLRFDYKGMGVEGTYDFMRRATNSITFHICLSTSNLTKWPKSRDMLIKFNLFEDFWTNFKDHGSECQKKRSNIFGSLSKNSVIFIDEISQVPANWLWTLVNVLREINNPYTRDINITTDNDACNSSISNFLKSKPTIPKFCIIALGDFKQNKPVLLEGIVNQMGDPLLYKHYLQLFGVYLNLGGTQRFAGDAEYLAFFN